MSFQQIVGSLVVAAIVFLLLVVGMGKFARWYQNANALFEHMSQMKVRRRGMTRAMTQDELSDDPEYNFDNIDEYEFFDESDNKWKPVRVFYGQLAQHLD